MYLCTQIRYALCTCHVCVCMYYTIRVLPVSHVLHFVSTTSLSNPISCISKLKL